MSTTGMSHETRRPATGLVVLRRAIVAEWTRLWTVRSTWWATGAAAAMLLFVGVAFGLDVPMPAPVWVAGELGIVFAQFALLIPVMLAVTGEYSTGAIRSTLQAVPRRGVLALARTVVTVVVATVLAVALVLAADLASWVALGADAEVVAADVLGSLGAVGALVAAASIMTLGIGASLRSSAGTLTTVFMLWLVLPTMLPAFGVAWLATIGTHLPGSAGMALLDAFGDPVLSTTRAIIVLCVWLTAAVAAGLLSLTRRDAA
jgi:hypothetical protein